MPHKTDQQATAGRPLGYGLATWGVLAWGTLAFGLIGIWFRLWELGQQLVFGDEMHALKSAAGGSLTSILAERGLPDVSIPVALWNYHLLRDWGLSEWGMRFPMLLSGILFLLLLPRIIHRQLGTGCAFTATGLAALSPLLIQYSRFARPYMPLVLLSLLALDCWLRHLNGSRYAWSWAILVTIFCAALTPVSIPALGALAGAAVGLRYFENRSSDRVRGWNGFRAGLSLRALVIAAIGVSIAVVALRQTWQMGAQLTALAEVVNDRGRPIQWGTVGLHLIGTTRLWVVYSLAGLTLAGAVITWMHARRFALLVTVMTITQVLVIVILVPWGDRPFSIVRYCMVLFPGLLCWTALGLDACAGLIRRKLAREDPRHWARLGVTSVALLLLVGFGPLPRLFRAHNSFTSFWPTVVHLPPSYGSEERPAWPHFYNALMDYPVDVAIMEAPTVSINRTSVMLYASYQRVHRRRVLLMSQRSHYRHEKINLQSTLLGKGKVPGEVVLGDAAILVLHKDLEGESRYLHLLHIAWVGEGQNGANKPRSDDHSMVGRARAPLSERSAAILTFCLQDRTLKTIYEDRWVRAFSRDPQVIAARKTWKRHR
jgi:hypothetical protein